MTGGCSAQGRLELQHVDFRLRGGAGAVDPVRRDVDMAGSARNGAAALALDPADAKAEGKFHRGATIRAAFADGAVTFAETDGRHGSLD